jgi:hypothetical protein
VVTLKVRTTGTDWALLIPRPKKDAAVDLLKELFNSDIGFKLQAAETEGTVVADFYCSFR